MKLEMARLQVIGLKSQLMPTVPPFTSLAASKSKTHCIGAGDPFCEWEIESPE